MVNPLDEIGGSKEVKKHLHTIAGALRWAIEESGGEIFFHREGTGKMFPTREEQQQAMDSCPQCHPELRKEAQERRAKALEEKE